MNQEDDRYCVSNLAKEISESTFDVVEDYPTGNNSWRVQFISKKYPNGKFQKGFVVGVNLDTGEVCFVSDSPSGQPHRLREYIDSTAEDKKRLNGFHKHFRDNMDRPPRRKRRI